MLDHWKQKLIDFSKKNQLIYFKFKSKSYLELTKFSEEQLESLLQGKAIKFNKDTVETHLDNYHPQDEATQESLETTNPENQQQVADQDQPKEIEIVKEETQNIPAERIDENEQSLNISGVKSFVDPLFYRNKLIERLRSRDRIAKQDLGANILYLAYGFLDWKESEYSEKLCHSPLFLIPIYIERSSGLAPKYNLTFCEEEEIVFNPALRMFFKQSLNLNLDFIPEKLDESKISLAFLNDYLMQLQTFVQESSCESWVVNQRKCISVFNFQKLVLFKEMELFGHKMQRHPIISKLQQRDVLEQKDFLSASEIDKLEAKDNFCILDADSSQQEAINAAKQGLSFVLDGPPGTGKSQTIANIISELLAQGKKVLFVSEKKAALNVVKERLESCGLDNFCLVLHDTRKKDKVSFIKRLNESFEKLDTEYNYENDEDYQIHFRKYEEKKKELNEYAQLLHEPFGESKIKPFMAYAKASSLSEFPNCNFAINNFSEFDELKWDKVTRLIQKLSQRKELEASSTNTNPWNWIKINSYLSLAEKEELFKNTSGLKTALDKCRNKFNKLFSLLSSSVPKSVSVYEVFEPLLEHLSLAPPQIHSIFNQQSLEDAFNELLAKKNNNQEYLELKNKVYEFALEGCSKELIEDKLQKVQQFQEMNEAEYTGTDEYNAFENELLECFYVSGYDIPALKDIRVDLETYKQLIQHQTSSDSLVSDFCKEISIVVSSVDEDKIEELETWVSKLLEFQEQITSKLQETLKDKKKIAEIKKAYKETSEAKVEIEAVVEAFNSNCKLVDWKDREIIAFANLLTKVLKVNNSQDKSLDEWIDFCILEEQFAEEGLAEYFETIVEDQVAPQKLLATFEKRFYTLWLDEFESKNPKVKSLRGEDLNEIIKSFQELDREHFQKINQKRIFEKIQKDFLFNKIPATQLKTLCTLARQKRPRKSIRAILRDLRKLILEVHPCWMMSPLSVCQLIELEKGDNPNIFDTVIFDEASQIFPEDAICSIFRGKQLIVAGDPEQMPPTSFGRFSAATFDEFVDEEEEPEFESILNLASISLKQKRPLRLLWHYRSKYEELIHPSNQKIYNGNLITFPVAKASEQKPVEFEYIENGVFDRGKTKTNKAEAQRVAEHLISILKEQKEGKRPRQSIGIIALGTAQMECIEDELDKLRIKNPEMEEFFVENIAADQRIFIKNLETVQGDERDIILLSIGYGKDASGKLYQNFGPINQKEVGHRRLNVAITRAKQQVVVFCSFHHHELSVTEEHSRGLNFLRDYLCYAETGILTTSKHRVSKVISSAFDLREEIKDRLSKEGLKIQSNVGRSEYKLDLAVVDPNDESKFVLGIECDGEMYHSAKTCRDRERLRTEVLANFGWDIHRVWSRNWWLDPERETKKVMDKVREYAQLDCAGNQLLVVGD